MQSKIEEILAELMIYINSWDNNFTSEIEESTYLSVKEKYFLLKENGTVDSLYKRLKNILFDKPELYIFFLSIIYDIVKDDKSITEALNHVNDKSMDLFTRMIIRGQIEYRIFQNSKLSRHYDLRRIIHKELLKKSEEMINIQLPYRPYNMRNKRRIVIVVSQLIHDLHAPTNIIMQISSLLKSNFDKEILLIVALDDMYSKNLYELWFKPIVLNYIKEYNGSFKIECNGEIIHGMQFMMNQNNIPFIQDLIKKIYDFNPLFVWSMGTFSIFADIFRNLTTVVSMPFSDGYAVSEAQIMCSYLNSHSNEIKEMEAYFAESNQRKLSYELGLPLTPSENIYDRQDYDIKEKDFVIAIVGNRLDIEIDQDFKSLLKRILEIDSRILVVFIGVYRNYSNFITDEDVFEKRTKYLGFQEDLIGVLSIMDLFLNPLRQGGGGGAVYSLFNGVPVVTLGECDVANSLESEDICKSFEEMYHLVRKYFYDTEFYGKQSEKALEIRKKRSFHTFFSNTKRLIDEIEKILE